MSAKVIALLMCIVVAIQSQKIVIKTEKLEKDYNFFPLQGDYIELDVKASSDIHIALTETFTFYGKYYEIVYGGWNNTKSAIKKDHYDNQVAVKNGAIINPIIFEKYWVNINRTSNVITTGKMPSIEPLMVLKDADPFNVTYFGISTGYGSSGEWHIDANYIATFPCLNIINYN